MKNSKGYGSNPSEKWSRQHDCCLKCKRTDVKHIAKGLCLNCYSVQYSSENPDKVAVQKKASYLRQGGKQFSKFRREQQWFDGQREAALKRDNYKCTSCGATENLTVHHIDGNGRGSKNPNNKLENLITLCRSCHAKEHQTLSKWSKQYDKCISCGTTSVKHNAKGLCSNCYYHIHKGIRENN